MAHEQMLAKMTETRTALEEFLAKLDEETCNIRPADGRWTIRENVAHLVDAERAHRRFIETLLAGETPPTVENFDLDRYNAAKVKKRAGQSTAELLAALRAEREKTLATLHAIPDDSWDITGEHVALGTVSVRQVAKIIGVHERGHLKDMRSVLAEISNV